MKDLFHSLYEPENHPIKYAMWTIIQVLITVAIIAAFASIVL